MHLSRVAGVLFLALSSLWPAELLLAEDFDGEPIRYSQTQPDNRVSRLVEQLQQGQTQLAFDPTLGYLPSLLEHLEVPVSSQTLVYSKTSLQRHRITPRTPRALYFGDDVYVGYCQNGEVLEISAADPTLGAVFYALDVEKQEPPRLVRQTDNCLICHSSSQTKDVPGHVVRSVFVDASGLPLLASGTYRIDHTSPLKQRWGGWYVTGTHGDQSHLGNLIVRGRQEVTAADNVAGQNVTDLKDRFDTTSYLTPHSDIVALMVLEHQADAHNYITRANFLTRQATHYQSSLNRELGEPADKVWDSTTTRIKSACEPLVEYLLMSEEAELTHRIQGTTSFAEDFARRGPRDRHGRSLRDLDLTRRMFKHPCSYLIYSTQFAALPEEAKEYVFRRLWEVLSGKDQTKYFAHLSAADRTAIREILQDTLPELPAYWRENAASNATAPRG